MRFLLLILFVSAVLTEEQTAKVTEKKVEEKKEPKKSIDEQTKSKTGKRDSSDQINSYGINANDEPFKPMLNSPTPFVAAASDTQQVYYDKNQVTIGAGIGNVRDVASSQAANAYRAQEQNKNHLRVNPKNVVVQQHQQQPSLLPHQQQHNNQPNNLYAEPQNPAYHYERIPQQQQQQQHVQLPAQRGGQQKQIQYLIAIPMTYLRQIQQQLIHQQQPEQPSQLQVFKGQQQSQYHQPPQKQIQALPVYTVAGPLARDHQGSYRPFHRFAPSAANDLSNVAQHQAGQVAVASAPAPPGYVTQYVQIPASVLIAAMQSPHAQQQLHQLRSAQSPQQLYHHQQQPQHPQVSLQLQQPQQHQLVQTPTPQMYYYQPQQQQQQYQQLKQSQPLTGLTSPPVYAYHVNPLQQQQQQQQLQQSSQQLPTYQHLTEQQQVNDGKQVHRIRGIRPTANLTPSQQQYDPTVESYESEEKAQIIQSHAPAHLHTHTPTHPYSNTNAHNQLQYTAQAPIARQQTSAAIQHQLATAPTPAAYEHIVHYNPQYVQHYQTQQPFRHQPHSQRLQIQPQQHTPFVEHLNNLQYSQGFQGPTSFLRLPSAAAGETSLHNLNIPPFVSGAFQSPFTPLGMPSKVTSFTNVLLQPFTGHASSLPTTEITAAAAAGGGGAESLPFQHSSGGIRYATHLYHPAATSAVTLTNGNKQVNAASHSDARLLNAAGETKISAATVKSAGASTVVKYP